MKRRIITLLTAVLCVALLLAGCAESQSSTTADTPVQTVSTAAGTDSSELFSDRDLSGEYDDTVVSIELTGTGASASSDAVTVNGSNVTVTAAGTYVISGTLTNGSVIVDADKEDKVQLVLDGVSIHSDTYAPIYVKQADKVFITLKDGTQSTLSNGGSFVQTDDNNVDAVIFAKDDLTLNGTGALTVTSPAGHGIVGKDDVVITSGTYTVTAAQHAIRANDSLAIADGTFTLTADEDGLHAENKDDDTLGSITITGGTFTVKVGDDGIHATTLLQLDSGTFDITAAEGLEATCIRVNDGAVSISASDDGINAAHKSSAYSPAVEINGGDITIVMGAGDTDGIDSNGDLIITGGTVNVSGQSAFDYDGTATYTGGTIIVNGQTVNSIPNQMMGGGFGGGIGGQPPMHR
ncbi:MAG: carbohydrate-binding domain-containing protein, partial [Clostridia bacterium]|nr:carbohydrate-binding domain-containing protein [Clostridia bacterium]